jgi:hypothetical protein
MKKAVDKEDLNDANRQEDTVEHHLEEMARLKSEEGELRVTRTGTPAEEREENRSSVEN